MVRVTSVDVLVVGAGPAGAAAAYHAARRGFETLLIDSATFPRDKTCGDGLTPRAIHQLQAMGVDVTSHYVSHGLKLHGFGGSVTAPWPDTPFGTVGSAMPRTKLDAMLVEHARAAGVTVWEGATATEPMLRDGRVTSVQVTKGNGEAGRGVDNVSVACNHVIVADGVRSTFGKLLGRQWHKDQVFGIAARAYCETPRSHEPWIHSHLELRDADGTIQPGYGWIFPLGDGRANVGCGALSTTARPAKINTKKLLHTYASGQHDWNFSTPQHVASALLPMGGAVSKVAGKNWMLIGDAAACVNPLNGEGIDYGLETAQLAVDLLGAANYTTLWPDQLRAHYGHAFLLARTLARALTYPKFLPLAGPLAFRSPFASAVMNHAARLMGNLVTDEDQDVVSRVWRAAGVGVGWGVGRGRGVGELWGE